MTKKQYVVKNNIMGVISYKDRTISSFIIVDKIDTNLRELADKGIVTISNYIKGNTNDEFEIVKPKKRKTGGN